MKATCALSCGLVLLLLAGGCATGTVAGMIDHESVPLREFQPHLVGENPAVGQGSYVGDVKARTIAYRHYQFANVLVGPRSRILDIFVPDDPRSKALIDESLVLLKPLEPAHLLLKHVADADPPADYLKTHYPNVDPAGLGKHAMYVNLHSPPDVYCLQSDPKSGKLLWRHLDAKDSLSWRVRSRFKYASTHLLYLISVPWDIISWPFQHLL